MRDQVRLVPRGARAAVFTLVVLCGLGVGSLYARKLATRHAAATELAPVVPSAHPRPLIGYNLDYPGDWSDAVPFLDLMHDARPWDGAGGADHYAQLDLDAHGWPRTLKPYYGITAIVRTGGSPDFVGHVWVVRYRGEGTLTIDGSVEVLDQKQGEQGGKEGTIRFRARAGNVWLSVRATDPRGTGDYIRDISIVREDRLALAAAGKIFNPDLLSFLAPYRSLRFMDWMLSNDPEAPPAGRWAARSRMDQPQWRSQFIDPRKPGGGLTTGGYPVEVMVALANELKANPHFNMPYLYDDDYARQFATVVAKQLSPSLRATVEYSNEVWNWGFPQASYARTQAEALWPGESSGWVQLMGARAANLCRIWKDVFGPTKSRVRCVIAPQTGWPDLASASLDCPRWAAMGHKPCAEAVDAIAVTGYFNGLLQRPENAPLIKTWLAKGKDYALTQAFQQLERGDVPGVMDGDHPADPKDTQSLRAAIAALRTFATIAQRRGLELYVYEGGTHFDNDKDNVVRQFLLDVTHDARMKGLYLQLFQALQGVGGTVFNVWGGIGDTSWSNAANLADRHHPKYEAAAQFSAGR